MLIPEIEMGRLGGPGRGFTVFFFVDHGIRPTEVEETLAFMQDPTKRKLFLAWAKEHIPTPEQMAQSFESALKRTLKVEKNNQTRR